MDQGGSLPPGRRGLRVLAVGAAVVVAVTGVVAVTDLRSRAGRQDDAKRVLAAVASGDCATAAEAFRSASTGLALPGRRPAISADITKAAKDCGALATVDALAASGKSGQALNEYVEFQRTHTFSPLHKAASGRIEDVLGAGKLRADRETCRALHTLAQSDSLPGAADTLPALLTACGQLLAPDPRSRDDDFWQGFELLSTVREKYADSPDAEDAERAEAALRVELAGRYSVLETPSRAGGGAKLAKVRFLNYGAGTMLLSVSGPGGGRVVQVQGCSGCGPAGDALSVAKCERADAPGTTLTLRPGTYRVAVEYTDTRGGYSWPGEWKLRAGSYADCLAPAA